MAAAFGEDAATLRLVAAPDAKDGAYLAGVEIRLPPGAHTYWKNPGEAGVPPVFSFDGSRNVASAAVEFPVPKRITEEGLDAIGYDGTVVFPVVVRPREAGQPIVLHASVSYAVCSKICLPRQDTADLEIPSGAKDAAAVMAALAEVPMAATSEQRAAIEITPLPGMARPSWLLTWIGAPVPSDIFCTTPDGYVFTTHRRGAGSWTVTEASAVSGPHTGKVPVEFTVAAGGKSFAVTETMDVPPLAQ